jgi:anti-anti-sigma regulatory factor
MNTAQAQSETMLMLRISSIPTDPGITLKLEGTLMGPWIDELNNAFASAGYEQSVTLDLGDLTFVDAAGTDALIDILRRGARVAACSRFVAELLSEAHHVSERDDP